MWHYLQITFDPVIFMNYSGLKKNNKEKAISG